MVLITPHTPPPPPPMLCMPPERTLKALLLQSKALSSQMHEVRQAELASAVRSLEALYNSGVPEGGQVVQISMQFVDASHGK